MQVASGGEVEVTDIRDAAGKGALFGAGGALAEAGIYHAATHAGAAPEIARAAAQQGVAVGFCLIAVGTDVWSEVAAARRGDISAASAASGSCAKAVLDLLPLVLAPLGLWGVPVLLGAQLGGRWVISRLRAMDQALGALAVIEDLGAAVALHSSLDQMLDEADALQVRVCLHRRHLPKRDGSPAVALRPFLIISNTKGVAMPFIPWIIAGIAALVAGAAIADDVDQRNKRAEEQQRFRREIARLSTTIAELERAHATLSSRLGEKDQQVRALAEEVLRLRAELAEWNRRAAA